MEPKGKGGSPKCGRALHVAGDVYAECTERVIDAVGGLSHVTSIHHNQSDQMASSLGYGSCVH